MTVVYYKNASAPNQITKKLTQIVSQEIANKDAIDLINPAFDVTYNAAIAGANYMHISAPLNRYYFIHSAVMTGGRMRISGNVDVLMTAGNALRQQGACVVARNQYQRNYYVNDKDITLSEKPSVTIKKWNYEFKNYSIFMLAAGGN